MTVSQVARLLQVGAATVRRWVREDRLRAIRLPSGGIRVRREELSAFGIPSGQPHKGVSDEEVAPSSIAEPNDV